MLEWSYANSSKQAATNLELDPVGNIMCDASLGVCGGLDGASSRPL